MVGTENTVEKSQEVKRCLLAEFVFLFPYDHDRPKFGPKIKSMAKKLIRGGPRPFFWNSLPCAYTGENNLETSISPIRPGPHRIKIKLSCYLQINLASKISHPNISANHSFYSLIPGFFRKWFKEVYVFVDLEDPREWFIQGKGDWKLFLPWIVLNLRNSSSVTHCLRTKTDFIKLILRHEDRCHHRCDYSKCILPTAVWLHMPRD